MKTLYLECSMGAAGDMLTGALLELLPEHRQEEVLKKLNEIGLEGVTVSREKTAKCGIMGSHMHVLIHGEEEESLDVSEHHDHHDPEHHHHHEEEDHEHLYHHEEEDHEHHHHHEEEDHEHHHHHHHHTSMQDIRNLVSGMDLPEEVKKDILAVYGLLAEAESHAHGMPVEEIHFHEVGTKDAVMDVTAVCLLMHEIHPDQVLASPVHVGSGQVQCAHGIMPVPAPATEYLLRGIPSYQREDVRGELCTPTGAALLRYFVKDFGPQPVMRVQAAGYGMGTKDFPMANCVRAFLGETEEGNMDEIVELRANVDDMTAEEIGYAMEEVFQAGARDVFTEAVNMKKNRPGTLITVLADKAHEEAVVRAIFQNTSTIGIRRFSCDRYTLERRVETVHTEDGDIRVKTSSGYGVTRSKYEFDDLAAIARKTGKSIRKVQEEADRAQQK